MEKLQRLLDEVRLILKKAEVEKKEADRRGENFNIFKSLWPLIYKADPKCTDSIIAYILKTFEEDHNYWLQFEDTEVMARMAVLLCPATDNPELKIKLFDLCLSRAIGANRWDAMRDIYNNLISKWNTNTILPFAAYIHEHSDYFEKLSDVKMPATKLELLVKMLRKQITEYGKTNQMAAKKFQEMLEETIKQYHERRKHLSMEEAGEAQEETSEEIIRNATDQALQILKEMRIDRNSFRKVGLTFEEKAFYDILMALRDQYNFEYGTDKIVDGVSINEKCKCLAKKIKDIIEMKSSFADWLNNQIVRDQLKFDIKVCLIKNGYPPQYTPEVFRKVMEQVENFEENN